MRPPPPGLLLTTASPTRPRLAPTPVGLGGAPPPKGRGPPTGAGAGAGAGAAAGVQGLEGGAAGAAIGWKPPAGAAGLTTAKNDTIVTVQEKTRYIGRFG